MIPGGQIRNAMGSSISTQVAAAVWVGIKSSNPNASYNEVIGMLNANSKIIKGARGQEGKLIMSSQTAIVAQAPAPTPTPKPVVKTAEQLAAEAKAALVAESAKEIAAAEAQYQLEIKAAAEKLAKIKADWNKKING
jgi:hypothetical protein